MSYLECCPENFDTDKKYPVILHLHGAGSIGTDIKILYNQPIVKYAQNADVFPVWDTVYNDPAVYEWLIS